MLCLWLYSKGGMLCVICHVISHANLKFSSCFGLTRYITCYITPCLGGHFRVPLQGLHRSGSPPLPHRLRLGLLVLVVLFRVRNGPATQRPGPSPAGNLHKAAREQIPGPLGPDGFKYNSPLKSQLK